MKDIYDAPEIEIIKLTAIEPGESGREQGEGETLPFGQ